jgi:acyl-CoA dehydrogenase
MHQLAQERLIIAIRAAASIEAFLERTIAWTRERKVFGQSVFDYQNTRFKLAEAKAKSVMLRTFVDDCLARHLRGELDAERAAMAKLNASEMQNQLLDELLQMHGGTGFMADGGIGSAWVDARVARIYGGSNEIMKEIVARGL